MASSPPSYAGSPTIPTLSLPKKRPSLAPPGPVANPKRRKPSTGPSSLRQTSFPPDGTVPYFQQHSRSPSVESSIAGGSVISAATGGVGVKGKRKKKKGDDGDDAASSVNGEKARTTTGRSEKDGAAANNEEEEDDEDEVDANEGLLVEGDEKVDEAAARQEREHLRMLVDAFNEDQSERYELWRRVKLKKEIVRKITNQTLSQSVPPSVIITINASTKVFIGQLIDMARTVQAEWVAAADRRPNPNQPNRHVPNYPNNPGDTEPVPPDETLEQRTRECLKGPLLPDHLREALRRYKKDREGGAAGFVGLSLQGKESTASRAGGKRLFR